MINKIFHLSDIHIRLSKRQEQYKQVLEKVKQEILRRKDDNSIIIITGDLFHTKLELSPEAIDMAGLYLTELSNILPTFVITGNHDANLSNKNRLDALTPIIELIDGKNLFYLRDTDWYNYDNLNFWVASVFDERLPLQYPEKLNNNYNILLYHGRLDGIQVNNITFTGGFKLQDFSKFDYALLGDIHKRIIFNNHCAYAGSLIQLNYGEEPDGHGLLLWNLDNASIEQIDILNNYAYYNLIVKDGEIINKPDITAKHPRIKIKYSNTDLKTLRNLQTELKRDYGAIEILLSREDIEFEKISTNLDYNIEDINDVEYQQKLIREYIKDTKKNIDNKKIEALLDINKEMNETFKQEIQKDNGLKKQQNIWSIEKLEFDNFFSYEQNNVINFNSHKDIVGIVGENAAGKSSIIDCILFMLYDRTSRGNRALSILNNKKDRLWGRITLNINNKLYYIEKSGELNKKGDSLPIKIRFYTIDDNTGEEIDLSGVDRNNTNNIIASYIGDYEDAINTFISTQGNSNLFIEMQNANRKQLLNSLLNLQIFDKFYDESNDKLKELKGYLATVNIQNLETELDNIKNNIQVLTGQNVLLQQQIDECADKIKNIELERDSLLSQKKAEIDIDFDVDKLNNEIIELNKKIEDNQVKIQELLKQRENIETLIQNIKSQMAKVNIDDYKQKLTKLNEIYNQYTQLNIDYSKTKALYEEQQKKVKLLENVKYNPECPYCMSNPLTLDAIQTRKKVAETQAKLKELETKLNEYSDSLKQRDIVLEIVNNYNNNLVPKYNQYIQQLNSLDNQKLSLEQSIQQYNNKIEQNQNLIKVYNDNKIIIEQNRKIDEKLLIVNNTLKDLNNNKNNLNAKLQSNLILIATNQQKIETIEQNMRIYYEKNNRRELLDLYKNIIGKNGLQYYITSKVVKFLEKEVNSVLELLTNFSIEFILDGKNIDINVVYSDKIHSVQTCSGFEKFIISIALRHSLSIITNKSKGRLFVIDEGFGVMDADNIASLGNVLDFIAENYETLLIISHLETMKSMFDDRIEIEYKDGRSIIHQQ